MRKRATAIILRQGQILLARDRGHIHYSLPGGGIDSGETIIAAAVRELFEELGIEAFKALRLPECDYAGSDNMHYVVLIESQDTPIIQDEEELNDFLWWNGEVDIPCYTHVKEIWNKFLLLAF